jgi:hypothetical protein
MDSDRLIEKLKKGYVKIKSKTNVGQQTSAYTLNRELIDGQVSMAGRNQANPFSKSLRKPYRYLDVFEKSTNTWTLIRWDKVVEVDGRKIKSGIIYIG